MQNKTLSQSISDFSKKLSRFNDSGRTEPERTMSPDAILQKKITDVENDRRERILKQINSFINPVSQQIEEDEDNLIKAYNLFKQASELNANSGQSETKIADLKITSPLCTKNEYVSGSGFLYLRIWFITQSENSDFVPVIVRENEKAFIEFIEKEKYEFSRLEKEILQLIPESVTDES